MNRVSQSLVLNVQHAQSLHYNEFIHENYDPLHIHKNYDIHLLITIFAVDFSPPISLYHRFIRSTRTFHPFRLKARDRSAHEKKRLQQYGEWK